MESRKGQFPSCASGPFPYAVSMSGIGCGFCWPQAKTLITPGSAVGPFSSLTARLRPNQVAVSQNACSLPTDDRQASSSTYGAVSGQPKCLANCSIVSPFHTVMAVPATNQKPMTAILKRRRFSSDHGFGASIISPTTTHEKAANEKISAPRVNFSIAPPTPLELYML